MLGDRVGVFLLSLTGLQPVPAAGKIGLALFKGFPKES